ncbi:MAG: hypothetical protein HDR35_05525 [Treponema sp.]|nr:hypothetical protein [Treponema sp.]
MKMSKEEFNAKQIICIELLFSILPLLIIFILHIALKKNVREIFTGTDISFVSVVLFGQTVIKFMSGIAKSDTKKNWQKIAFISSLLFILGIVPAVSFLIIIYTNKEISKIVYVFQSIWFLLAIITYWIIGTIGQMYLDE